MLIPTVKNLKIAFDLDGTYISAPKMFDHIYRQFKKAGHRVGILSCRCRRNCILGFEPDFEFYGDCSSPTIPPQVAWKTKIMLEHGITILFDDMAEAYDGRVVVIRII